MKARSYKMAFEGASLRDDLGYLRSRIPCLPASRRIRQFVFSRLQNNWKVRGRKILISEISEQLNNPGF
jgi:hypothetical protein